MVALSVGVRDVRLANPQNAMAYCFITDHCSTKISPIPCITACDNVVDCREGHLLVIEVSVTHSVYSFYPGITTQDLEVAGKDATTPNDVALELFGELDRLRYRIELLPSTGCRA